MLSVNNVIVEYGGFTLFKDISFVVNPRDRIGLVGKNGAGKSTLLKIIMGQQKPDGGTISYPGEITIGYLPQHMIIKDEQSVWEECKLAFHEINELKNTIERTTEAINTRTDHDSKEYLDLIVQLTHANERLFIMGVDNIDGSIEKTLLGLGFTEKDYSRPTREYSGGWRMRIELSKILLQKPDVLLLDEPTNHLDIESIQWLETFLRDYPGAVVIISHDRALLDNVTERTLEIAVGKITDYKVPYSKYVELRKERRQQEIAAYQNQQKKIEKTEEFIDRFRYKASKAVQVQSRIKELDRIDRIEIEEIDTSAINIKFPPAPRSGTIVVETKNLTKRYGNHVVLENLNMIIERGETVAFVGKNGEGKSTLSKIIINELSHEGECKLGHNVSIGYFAQNQDEIMNENKTVFQVIDDIAVGEIRTKIRDILGSFLFSGEDIEKKVKVLSGGERSRLALAKLLLKPYNLLVLDEPTNHLDMRSKDILKQALQKYDGTLIIVSHDREFLTGLTTKVYEFKNKKVKETIGDITEFLAKKKMESLRELERKNIKVEIKQEEKKIEKPDYEEKKQSEKEQRKRINQIKKCEDQITLLEKEIAAMDLKLADPDFFKNANNDPSIFEKYDKLKKELQSEMQNWEKLNEDIS